MHRFQFPYTRELLHLRNYINFGYTEVSVSLHTGIVTYDAFEAYEAEQVSVSLHTGIVTAAYWKPYNMRVGTLKSANLLKS